jgi:hypothetical protein
MSKQSRPRHRHRGIQRQFQANYPGKRPKLWDPHHRHKSLPPGLIASTCHRAFELSLGGRTSRSCCCDSKPNPGMENCLFVVRFQSCKFQASSPSRSPIDSSRLVPPLPEPIAAVCEPPLKSPTSCKLHNALWTKSKAGFARCCLFSSV